MCQRTTWRWIDGGKLVLDGPSTRRCLHVRKRCVASLRKKFNEQKRNWVALEGAVYVRPPEDNKVIGELVTPAADYLYEMSGWCAQNLNSPSLYEVLRTTGEYIGV